MNMCRIDNNEIGHTFEDHNPLTYTDIFKSRKFEADDDMLLTIRSDLILW